MTSSTGKQKISIHISRNKDNQTTKFDQLKEYDARKFFFFKNHEENEAGRLEPNLYLFFKKASYMVKSTGQHRSFNIFWQSSTGRSNESCLKFQAVYPKISTTYDFLQKGLGLVFPPHFCIIFKKNVSHVIFY